MKEFMEVTELDNIFKDVQSPIEELNSSKKSTDDLAKEIAIIEYINNDDYENALDIIKKES